MRELRTHLTYANVMVTLLAFVVLGGGAAYAADTIGSSDVIDESLLSQDIKNNEVKNNDLAANAVQTGKIADNQVFSADVRDDTLANGGLTSADIGNDQISSADVRDDTLPNGGLTAADLAPGAVGASELQGALFFDSQDSNIDDPIGGGATEEVLLAPVVGPPSNPPGYEIIARCLENPADTVKGSIVVRSVGAFPTRTTAVDSTAPNGVNNITSLAPGAEATLISHGPTTFPTYHTGQYSATNAGSAAVGENFHGNVAAGVNFANGFDCHFEATALVVKHAPGD